MIREQATANTIQYPEGTTESLTAVVVQLKQAVEALQKQVAELDRNTTARFNQISGADDVPVLPEGIGTGGSDA